MPANYNKVSVKDTATLIVAANSKRRNITIANNGTNDVFIGSDTAVTTANGLPVFGGSTRDSSKVSEWYAGDIYGIVAIDQTGDIRYWEELK